MWTWSKFAQPSLPTSIGRAQVDRVVLVADRAELLPPLDELRLPRLERPLQAAVAGEVDVVGDLGVDVDELISHPRFGRRTGRAPVPKRRSAPSGPTALGRWKIQFCHAERRAKIFVSIVSGPTKRLFASSPVRASGEKLARSSSRTRTSSAQSMSSKANVTSPASTASAAGRSLPMQVAGRGEPVVVAPAARRQPASGRWTSGTSRRWRRSGAASPAAAGRRRPPTCRRASACGRRRAPARRACRRSSCPGSTRATSVRADTSRRLSVRAQYSRTSRVEPVVVGEDGLGGGDGVGVARRAQHPRAELGLVEAQPQDGVVELAHGGQHPRLGAGGHELVGRRRLGDRRAGDGDPRRADGAVELDGDVVVARDVAVDACGRSGVSATPGPSSGRSDAAARASGPLRARARRTRCAGRRRRRGPTSTACWPLTPSAARGEHVGEVAADVALVDDAGEPAGAGQHGEQRDLGQRHRRRAVVDEEDLVARQRQLVAAAGGRAVDGGDPRLAAVRAWRPRCRCGSRW